MNLHVIIGEDDYLVSETAKKIAGDGVGLEVVDSLNSTNAELQLADIREADASFSTPPFLEPRKVTWWKNVHFLPGGGNKNREKGEKEASEAVKEALERFVTKLAKMPLPDNQRFILSGPHLLKTSIVAKTLAGAAEVVQFAAGKPWELAQQATMRVIEMAKEMGFSFAPGAVERFVNTVGTDTRSLVSELGKLRDYLGPAEKVATAEAVDAISSEGVGVEPLPWDVTDAIGRRDLAGALRALCKFELKDEKGFAVFMSSIIEKFFRQLLDCSEGRTEGLTAFALKKNRDFLGRWTPAELRVARARFFRLREKVVSGTTSGNALVVTNLVRVMRRGGRR